MNGSLQVAKLFGISIRLHFSWLFIFFLVSWSLARSYLPQEFPGWTERTYWAVGIAGSLLLFVSVLIHELSHSLVAISRGHKVRDITLFLLGGVSQIEEEAAKPGEEFWISIVGPLASFVLAGIAWGVFLVVGNEGSPQVRALSGYLGTLNIVLGVFNLLPGYPMDGGRVLRSIVWKATRSRRRATVIAATVGQLVGFGFIGGGIILAFTTSFVSGLWMAFVGWFIQSAAAASRQREMVNASLSGKKVREVMRSDFPTVRPGSSVQELVQEHMMKEFERAYIVMLGETFYGIVTASDVRRVEEAQRATLHVTEIMKRATQVVTASPDEPLEEAFAKLATNGVHQLPVVAEGRVVGLLTRTAVLRVLELTELLPSERARESRPK